jgi:AraC family transcriptional regulator
MLTKPPLRQTHAPLVNPALTVLQSSADLHWNEILVEHVRLHEGELFVPRLGDHIICMTLDPEFRLEQQRNGQTFVHTFEQGQAQVLPVETSGFWRTREAVHLLHLQFSHPFIQRIAAETADADPASVELIDQFLIEDPQVMHIGFALFTEMLEGGMNGSLYSGSLATALATHLLRKYALIRQKPVLASYRLGKTQLQRAVEYIHDHLADEIALETLAQQVNLSTSHFNAVFKQQFGLAPYQYILQQRVQRAKELLIHTDFSVAEVAADVGFYDQSHLTRHMRRLMGITPAALQRQRNVQNPH